MRLNKRTIAVSATTLTIVGGLAFALVTNVGSGQAEGAVAANTDTPVVLAADLDNPSSGNLNTLFDSAVNTVVSDVDATNPASNTHTYSVTLNNTTPTVQVGTVDPTTGVNDDSAMTTGGAGAVKCSSLLEAAVDVGDAKTVAPGATAEVGQVELSWAAPDQVANGCLGQTVTVTDLTSS